VKRSFQRPRSLRTQLILSMLLVLLPLLMGSIWHAYSSALRAADTAYDRSLLLAARSLAEGLHDADGQLLLHVPYLALDNLAWDSSGQIYYQILSENGQLLSGYENLPAPNPHSAFTTDYPALARFYNGTYRNQSVRLVSLLQAENNGMIEIRLAETRTARQRLADQLLSTSLWHLGLLSASVLLLCFLAVRFALRPLHKLRQALRQRPHNAIEPLPVSGLPREVLPLVRALNGFHQRLRHLLSQQSAFISDAAHELRTPLAALKAGVELGLRSKDAEDWQRALEQAYGQSQRLIHLANQLLSLARIESGAQALAEGVSAPLDLTALTREIALAMAPLAHQSGMSLELEAQTSVWIQGENSLLSELLANLLDNALKYANKTVILRVLPEAILEVEDDGPGLPPTDYANVFERFWQRQENNPNHLGAGLGLAIVADICRVHNAHISLHPANPYGLRVQVRFTEYSGLNPDLVPIRPNADPHTPDQY